MKCPFCEVWSDVIETRGARRRRECGNGHRFTTQEQLTSYSPRKVDDRNRQAAQMVLAGKTQTEVAEAFNMSRTSLSRYMRQAYPHKNMRSAGQIVGQRWGGSHDRR